MTGIQAARAGTEIERKFLLRDSSIAAGLTGVALVQGYFDHIDGWTVRLRTAAAADGGTQAWLTLKSDQPGIQRRELEMPVPFATADRLLAQLPPTQLIAKIRYRLPYDPADPAGLTWEIDRFLDRHHGLWLAEMELPRADYPLRLPAWLGPEVTDDPRYRNAALAASPGKITAPAPPELRTLVQALLAQTGMAGQSHAIPA